MTNSLKNIIAGVDEAGRGPWAGPVIVSAVYLSESITSHKLYPAIQDSKKLSAKKREQVFEFLCQESVFGLGAASSLYIDKYNILQATFHAMRQSIYNLQKNIKSPITKVLVDGNQKIPDLNLPQEAIIQGDSREKCIAAASILAKVTRDRLMLALGKKYPQYGFAKNKGYGTIEHRLKLLEFGICPIHRRSFAPIRAITQN